MVTLIKWRTRALNFACSIFAVSGLMGTVAAQNLPAFQGYPAFAQADSPAQAPPMPNQVLPVAANPVATAASNSSSLVHQIRSANERLEITANSSRIIKLGKEIPRAQVNNKALVDITPLSKNEIQIFAKKPGVTQLNIWHETDGIHTIDLLIYGDARELEVMLATEYPNSKVKVRPIGNSVVLSGYVSDMDQTTGMIQMSREFYPNVISHITVGGVQQVSLKVEVMEVSRTKLRNLAFDGAFTNGSDFVITSISQLIASASATPQSITASGDTVRFGIVSGNDSFFGFIQAMRRYNVAKVLAEPTINVKSGRPARFNAGGEFPVLVPQSLGTVSIAYKTYGTQVDVVPIVLGNGNVHIEVKPRVSEIDETRSVTINGTTVPGLRVREVDTGVEMKVGQTMALAGLVQTRYTAVQSGIPWLSDLPVLGAAFRKSNAEENEVELLIMVTPQYVSSVDPCEVPQCLPGSGSAVPGDWDYYMRGHVEIPSCGPCSAGYDSENCGHCQPCQSGQVAPANMIQTSPTVAPQGEVIAPGTPTSRNMRMAPNTPYVVNRQQSQQQSPAATQQQEFPPIIPQQMGASSNRPTLPSQQQQVMVSDGPQQRTANRPSSMPAQNTGFIGPLGYDPNP